STSSIQPPAPPAKKPPSPLSTRSKSRRGEWSYLPIVVSLPRALHPIKFGLSDNRGTRFTRELRPAAGREHRPSRRLQRRELSEAKTDGQVVVNRLHAAAYPDLVVIYLGMRVNTRKIDSLAFYSAVHISLPSSRCDVTFQRAHEN